MHANCLSCFNKMINLHIRKGGKDSGRDVVLSLLHRLQFWCDLLLGMEDRSA